MSKVVKSTQRITKKEILTNISNIQKDIINLKNAQNRLVEAIYSTQIQVDSLRVLTGALFRYLQKDNSNLQIELSTFVEEIIKEAGQQSEKIKESEQPQEQKPPTLEPETAVQSNTGDSGSENSKIIRLEDYKCT